MSRKNGCLLGALVAALFVIVALFESFYTVPAGAVGVVTRFGAVQRVASPGFGSKIPFVETVHQMNTQVQKDEVDAPAASNDLQTVTSRVAINYRIDAQFATDIYQSLGVGYADSIISPAVQNIWKATTAQYTAQELIQKREVVRLAAEDAITKQLSPYHILVSNFNIISFDFSAEYDAAIEAKQVAQQNVQTAQQKLDQAKIDAQSVVVAAQGQADAQAALKNTGALSPEYLTWFALQKWNGILPQVTGAGGIPFINIAVPTTGSSAQPTSVPAIPAASPTPAPTATP